MPICGSGRIAVTVPGRRQGAFRWSTLTGRAPRALAARRRGDCWRARQSAAQPEVGQLQAYRQYYSSSNTGPARARRGHFCIAYVWQQILKSCLKKLRNLVNARLHAQRQLLHRRQNLVGISRVRPLLERPQVTGGNSGHKCHEHPGYRWLPMAGAFDLGQAQIGSSNTIAGPWNERCSFPQKSAANPQKGRSPSGSVTIPAPKPTGEQSAWRTRVGIGSGLCRQWRSG